MLALDGSALRILLLRGKSWWADLRCGEKQSLPQTRLRFQKEMIGLDGRSGSEEWEDERESDGRRGEK